MRRIFKGVILFAFLLSGSLAHAFTSGSTGVDGVFNPASNVQLQVPANGVFNYTTINIPLGVVVTFNKNTANTPVYMLATGDVTIGGTIDVSGTGPVSVMSGKGGPGGFDGGYGGGTTGVGGNGLGPGGGSIVNSTDPRAQKNGGGGGYATAGGTGYGTGAGGSAYGNVQLIPLIGGSGGAGGGLYWYTYIGTGGGGGGGAILIASPGTINVTGSIMANGGGGVSGSCYSSGSGGSGGAIRLIANTISGNGTISAAGGTTPCGAAGGNGRVRLEANSLTFTATTTPQFTAGSPGPVIVADTPSLQITSIGSLAVPQNPTGSYGTPDISLPAGTVNPVPVGISAANIPTGTTINVTVVPQIGAASTYTSTALSGTQQSSTATASVSLSSTQACVLMLQTTFNIQTAMNYNGEKITQAFVVASMGRGSQVTYITASGKRVPAEKLFAGMMK